MTRDADRNDDRRRHRRAVLGMPIQAVRRYVPPEDPSHVVSLHILNVCSGGVGAICHQELAPSQPLVLFFPPLGPGKGRDTVAQVVRCECCGSHYALGIAFDAPWPEPEEVAAQ